MPYVSISSSPSDDTSLQSEHTFSCTFAIPTGLTILSGYWARSIVSPTGSGTTLTADQIYFTGGADAVDWALYDGGDVADTIPVSSAQLAYIAANEGATLSAGYDQNNNPGIISLDNLQLFLEYPGASQTASAYVLETEVVSASVTLGPPPPQYASAFVHETEHVTASVSGATNATRLIMLADAAQTKRMILVYRVQADSLPLTVPKTDWGDGTTSHPIPTSPTSALQFTVPRLPVGADPAFSSWFMWGWSGSMHFVPRDDGYPEISSVVSTACSLMDPAGTPPTGETDAFASLDGLTYDWNSPPGSWPYPGPGPGHTGGNPLFGYNIYKYYAYSQIFPDGLFSYGPFHFGYGPMHNNLSSPGGPSGIYTPTGPQTWGPTDAFGWGYYLNQQLASIGSSGGQITLPLFLNASSAPVNDMEVTGAYIDICCAFLPSVQVTAPGPFNAPWNILETSWESPNGGPVVTVTANDPDVCWAITYGPDMEPANEFVVLDFVSGTSLPTFGTGGQGTATVTLRFLNDNTNPTRNTGTLQVWCGGFLGIAQYGPIGYPQSPILVSQDGFGGSGSGGGTGGSGYGGPECRGWSDPYTGHQYLASKNAGKIALWRFDRPGMPPIALGSPSSSGATSDELPALYRDSKGRLFSLWDDGSDTRYAFSDDEGATWSASTTVFGGCMGPQIGSNIQTGDSLWISWQQDTAGHTPPTGTLSVLYIPRPEILISSLTPFTPKDQYGNNISVVNADFTIIAGYERAARWWLWTQDPVAGLTRWCSSDDGQTWFPVP